MAIQTFIRSKIWAPLFQKTKECKVVKQCSWCRFVDKSLNLLLEGVGTDVRETLMMFECLGEITLL